MAVGESLVVPLGTLAHGQQGDCFAILAARDKLLTKKGLPYFKCQFRARHDTRSAMIWSDHALFIEAADWKLGVAYRLIQAVGEQSNFGPQLKLQAIRHAGPEDEVDGYCYNELVDSSDFSPMQLWDEVRACVHEHFSDDCLKTLIKKILVENRDLFIKIPAAQSFHHAYASGLLEHVWSLTRICVFLADHYASYYRALDPPLNKDLLLTAAIVHDIGKLRELCYDMNEATYTVPGRLIGHVVMGRDMIRDAARQIEGFPDETLMLLEHAILAHHGKREFGAPVLPQTLEALIVSFADDLDAKINTAARERLLSTSDDPFTNYIKALERPIYKGVKSPSPADSDFPR